MVVNFQVAEKARGSYRHIAILRWVMVFIFLWFGIQKFSEYAAEAIQPLIANSPFISWLGYFGTIGEARIIGTIELTTAAILIVGSRVRAASALGSAMASGTFALTSSFIFTTPGITQFRSTGFPIVSTLIEQFLIKDIALLAMCLVLLISSLGSDLPPPRDS
jgi:uncharacterized membrane protein YkgB